MVYIARQVSLFDASSFPELISTQALLVIESLKRFMTFWRMRFLRLWWFITLLSRWQTYVSIHLPLLWSLAKLDRKSRKYCHLCVLFMYWRSSRNKHMKLMGGYDFPGSCVEFSLIFIRHRVTFPFISNSSTDLQWVSNLIEQRLLKERIEYSQHGYLNISRLIGQ